MNFLLLWGLASVLVWFGMAALRRFYVAQLWNNGRHRNCGTSWNRSHTYPDGSVLYVCGGGCYDRFARIPEKPRNWPAEIKKARAEFEKTGHCKFCNDEASQVRGDSPCAACRR